VIRAVEGPLASVRGAPPEEATYGGAASTLPRVWIAVRANLRRVVEQVTIEDIANSKLPAAIDKLAEDPEAWVTR
jgi:DNA-binding IscR family transcriptional regulator